MRRGRRAIMRKGAGNRNIRALFARALICFGLGLYLSGAILKAMHAIGGGHTFYGPISCTVYALKNGLFLSLIICLELFVFFSIAAKRREKKGASPGPFSFSRTGTKGTARFATEEEKKEHLNIGKPGEVNGLILGGTRDHRIVYAQREKDVANDIVIGTNNHIAIIGKSGSGKSFTFIKNAIYQCIHDGYSMFVTDPKGEMFEETYAIAEKFGYAVRVFNIRRPEEFSHSDTFNPIHAICGDYSKAKQVAHTIITATAPERNVWSQFAEQLLIFLILYVDQDGRERGRTEEERLRLCNLGRIKLILDEGVKHILSLIDTLPATHPGYGAARFFANGESVHQIGAHTNLSDSMNYYNDPKIREMTTGNSMDLALPGKEKCIYYLIQSSDTRVYDFLASLFYTTAFSELMEEAELQPNNRLQRRVKFILEEFPNTCRIPDFPSKVNTLRSYAVDIVMCMQYVGQLKEQGFYSTGLLDAFDTVLFLGSNTTETAEYMEKRMGEATVLARSTSGRSFLTIPERDPDERETIREEARSLMTAAELLQDLNLGTGELQEVVLTYRMKPFICYTFPSDHHPYEMYRKDVKVMDYVPVQKRGRQKEDEPEVLAHAAEKDRQEPEGAQNSNNSMQGFLNRQVIRPRDF